MNVGRAEPRRPVSLSSAVSDGIGQKCLKHVFVICFVPVIRSSYAAEESCATSESERVYEFGGCEGAKHIP